MHDERWEQIAAHRERLLQLARRRCATPEDAEDIVQEALVRCATFAGLDETRLGPFLTSVTVRLCADSYRETERSHRIARRLVPEQAEEAGPEDALCRDVDVAMLAGLLHQLPERQRAVLVDRASGMSVDQISSRHALTYKAVESALARARRAMRSALASAFGLAGGVWLPGRRRFAAPVRPRRLVPAAPVASLAVAGTLFLPLLLPGGRPAGSTAGPEQAVVPAAGPEITTPAPVREMPPAEAAFLARRAAPAAPPAREPVLDIDGPGGEPIIEVTDERDDPSLTTWAGWCVDKGAWVRVNHKPDGNALVSFGCDTKPEPKPDHTDVWVSVDEISKEGLAP